MKHHTSPPASGNLIKPVYMLLVAFISLTAVPYLAVCDAQGSHKIPFGMSVFPTGYQNFKNSWQTTLVYRDMGVFIVVFYEKGAIIGLN